MAQQLPVSDQERHIGYWLRFVSNHVTHAFMMRVEAQGVTVAEWAMLRELIEVGTVSPSQLAEHLGMTRGAISKLVDRLCGKALAERTFSEGNRRRHNVTLTAKGAALVPILARMADENDHEFFGHLARPEQAELVRILKGIVQRQGWKDVPVS